MSCECNYEQGLLSGLLGSTYGLTAGSRVLFVADTEVGLIQGADAVGGQFRQLLRQMGLQVESVSNEYVDWEWGARKLRYYAQVITPIDRNQLEDLTWDMSQALRRASGAPVGNESITVLVRAGRDDQGNVTYPGGASGLPGPPEPPAPDDEKSIFDDIAEELDLTKKEAKAVVIGGGLLFVVLLMRR